jgi:hypothetical protein
MLSLTSLVLLAPTVASSGWAEPSLVIAVLALVVSLGTFSLAGRRTRLDRQRQVFAEAFEVVMEYREYPFMVRRRNPDEPEKERQRLAGELGRVQARLNAFKARLLVEDPYIGGHYAHLVKKTRHVAGAMIKAAWDNPPVSADKEMHAPKYDFSELDAPDNDYLQAVADHLGWLDAPVRRRLRERRRAAAPNASTHR